MAETERYNNFDILRAISCYFIVVLHVASMYKDCNVCSNYSISCASFYSVISSFAVPTFVMLSGAFLINNRNRDIRSFYRKTLYRIVFPTLTYSVVYVIMHYAEILVAKYLGIEVEGKTVNLLQPMVDWVRGEPHITMWYMYMIIGLYLLVPIIVQIKGAISANAYQRLCIFMFVYSIFVNYTCELSWILLFMNWIGYFFIGNFIFDCFNEKNRDNPAIGLALVFLSYVPLVVHWFVFSYKQSDIVNPGPFTIVVITGSIIQFVGYSQLHRKVRIWNSIRTLSKKSYDIYLIHPIICEIVAQVLVRIIKWLPAAELIPLFAAMIVVLSIIISNLILKIKRMLLRRFSFDAD